MLNQALTFRFEESGAGGVKGAVEGIGRATEETSKAATGAGAAMSEAYKAAQAAIDRIRRTLPGLASDIGKPFDAATAAAKRAEASILAVARASLEASRAAGKLARIKESLAARQFARGPQDTSSQDMMARIAASRAASQQGADASAAALAGAKEALAKSLAERWGAYNDRVRESTSLLGSVREKISGAVADSGGLGGVLSGAGMASLKIAGGLTAAAASAGLLMSKMLDLAAAGERGNQIAAAFEGGAEGMERLRDATSGLSADQTLQAAANTARSFGLELDNTADLMKLATAKALELGRDGTESISRVINGVTRGSNNLLEELGLRIPPTTQIYEEFAKKAGLSVDNLTDAQKRNAVAQRLIADNAEAMSKGIDTQGTSVQRAHVEWDNFVSTMQGFLAETLQTSGVLDILMGTMEMAASIFSENKDIIGQLINDGMTLLVQSLQNFMTIVQPLIPLLAQTGQIMSILAPVTGLFASALGAVLSVTVSVLNIALVPLVAALKALLDGAAAAASALGADGMAATLRDAAKGFDAFLASTDKNTEAIKKETDAAKNVAKAIDVVGASAEGAAPKVGGLADAMDKLTDEQKAAVAALADGTDIERAEVQVEKLGLSFNRSKHNLWRFEEQFGKLIDLTRSSDPDFEATVAMQEVYARAMERSGGNTKVAELAMRQYIATLKESFDVAGRGVGGLLQSTKDADDVLSFMHKLEAAVYNIVNPPRNDADKGAAKRAEERRELIYEASLIGMTEVQREVAEINKQLTDNLKTAGKNAEAITAANQIAASQIAPLLAKEFAIAGEISAQRFAEKFDNTLSEWADRRASALMRQSFSVEAIQGAIAEGMSWLDAGASFLGENFFTDSQMALAVFAEAIPNALAPLSGKIAATRSEFDSLLSSFDGEATSAAMAGMLAFADGIEVMSMAVSDNLGTMGEAFREMSEAAKLGDTSEATEKSFAALGKATQGAVAIGKAGANHFIKDKKKLAGVLGGFEIAEALGAAARLDFLGAAAHTLASIKYFAVAGGGAGSTAGSSRQRAQRQRTQLTRGNDAVLDRRNTGPSQVNNYFFSMLDQRAPGEAVMDALGRAAQNGSRAGIPGRLVSDGNIQRGL